MIIGVLGDSHGNVELMHNAVVLLDGMGATRYYHLGDNYADCDALIAEGYDVVRVPGIYAAEYVDHTVPRKVKETIAGIRFVLAHTESDVIAADLGESDVICVAHTHAYEVRDDVDRIVVNPGHLKGPESKGRRPSCGIIDVDEDMGVVKVRILALDSAVLEECSKAFDVDQPAAAKTFQDDVWDGKTERRRHNRRRSERRNKQEETQVRIDRERRLKERRQRTRRHRDRRTPEEIIAQPNN